MILRQWSGRAALDRPDDYPLHFRTNVVPELWHIPGFLGARLSRRLDSDGIEFTVISCWASMEAVRAFAGDEPEKAVVEPGAVAALVSFDEHVIHRELVEDVLAGDEASPVIALTAVRRRLDVQKSDISGSSFDDVSLAGARIHNVNFSGATFDDVNMSGWRIENANLAGLSIRKANLAGASVDESRHDTMMIDGVSVADLFAAYRKAKAGV